MLADGTEESHKLSFYISLINENHIWRNSLQLLNKIRNMGILHEISTNRFYYLIDFWTTTYLDQFQNNWAEPRKHLITTALYTSCCHTKLRGINERKEETII